MRKDVESKEHRTSAALEKLLEALSRPDSCSSQTCQAVLLFLKRPAPVLARELKAKVTTTVASTRATKRSGSAQSSAEVQCSSRDAQKLLKVCLATLKLLCPANAKSSDARRIVPIGRSVTGNKGLDDQSVAAMLGEICLCALNIWLTNTQKAADDLLPMAKTAYNIATRLIDLQESIYSLKALESLSTIAGSSGARAETSAEAPSVLRLLNVSRTSVIAGDPVFTISFQLLTLKYANLTNLSLKKSDLDCLLTPDSALDWCKSLAASDKTQADKFLSAVDRQLLKLATTASSDILLETHVVVLQSMLSEADPDVELMVSCLCRSLDQQSTGATFLAVDRLARRLMDLLRDQSKPESQRSCLLLVDRMTRYAQSLNLVADAEEWTQLGLKIAPEPSIKTALALNNCSLALSQARESSACSRIISSTVDSLQNVQTSSNLSPEEHADLAKSIESLRQHTLQIVKKFPSTAKDVSLILAVVASVIVSLLQPGHVDASKRWTSIGSALYQAWAVASKHDVKHFEPYISQWRILHSMLKKLEIDSGIQALLVALYNKAGMLYSSASYEAAAELLELYFEVNPLNQITVKRVEYLWSAHLQCHNYERAIKWLERTVLIESSVLQGRKMESIESCLEEFPYLSRLLTKLVALSKAHRITFSFMDRTAEKSLIIEIYLYHLQSVALSSKLELHFKDLMHELMLCTADTAAIIRVLGFGASCYRRRGDLDSMVAILSHEAAAPDTETFNSSSVAIKLHHARLSLHQLMRKEGAIDQLSKVSTDLLFIVDKVDAAGIKPTTRLCIQVLRDAAEILSALKLPRISIRLLTALLALETTISLMSSSDLIQVHALLAEQYLSCGNEIQSKAHIVLAQQHTLDVATGPLDAFRVALLDFRRSLILEEATSIERLRGLLLLADNVPRERSFEARAQVMLVFAQTAEMYGSNAQAIQRALEALQYARQCSVTINNGSDKTLAEDMSALTIAGSEAKPGAWREHSSAATGTLVHVNSYLARIHKKCGMIKDALYYSDEALRIATESRDADLLRDIKHEALHLRQAAGKTPSISEHELVPGDHNPYLQARYFRSLASLNVNLSLEEAIRWMQCSREALVEARAFLRTGSLIRPTSKSSRLPTVKRAPISKKPGSAQVQSSVLLDMSFRDIICDSIKLYQKWNRFEEAEKCRLELDTQSSQHSAPCLLEATGKLRGIQDILTKDPIYGTLQDSALSLPSTTSSVAEGPKSKRKIAHKPMPSSSLSADMIGQSLESAKADLARQFEHWLDVGDSTAAYISSNLYNTMNIMHSSLLPLTKESLTTSISSNYFLERSRALTIEREREKRQMELSFDTKSKWADKLAILEQGIMAKQDLQTRSTFQAQYIDALPKAWIVISAGLSPNHRELIVSRMQAGRTPLILRLPLSRHTSRDADEETFEFADAKDELLEIILLSNNSAQEAKHIKDKKGKTQWWSLRQSLDARLKTLLENIEHCWLGGFKGIFGASRNDVAALDTFRLAFARIVHKHVPLSKNRSFDLDSRVLDLFVDLGPIDADNSLELLEDLLYFVLDIYQFHGELIAYDEIEIDQMVVDVQAALHKYHDSPHQSREDEHTVLMFDKDLHIFPWESIPFLRGKSISRVPSISVLKTLLDSRAHGDMAISRASGSYILNPAGDLKATEKTLKDIFHNLQGWFGIVARRPEESEFLKYLEESPVFIYFGHGGGEQYVRASKIKRLKSCGAVILMGCSSGALKDQGEFDPWGTPYNYIVAGCPCLVANLWDVTDKDIDRFSLEMLGRWSLIESAHEPVSICAAVALSRDECNLQYLNGAAPVVYGLPLKLSS